MPRKKSVTEEGSKLARNSKANIEVDRTDDCVTNTRRNSLRQSIRSNLPDENMGEKQGEITMPSGDEGEDEDVPKSSAETSPTSRRKSKTESTKSDVSKRSIFKTTRNASPSVSNSPIFFKTPKGKEGKLFSLREESTRLNEEIHKLRKEVDLWSNRLKRGSRLAKFKKEMKPLDDRVKQLEEQRKQLYKNIEENRRSSAFAEKCITKSLSKLKTVLAAAKIPFTEAKMSNGKQAAGFLKGLSARDKASLLETLKQKKFMLSEPE